MYVAQKLSAARIKQLAELASVSIEQDGTPTDPYSLIASHMMLIPYEGVHPTIRTAVKHALHRAAYQYAPA